MAKERKISVQLFKLPGFFAMASIILIAAKAFGFASYSWWFAFLPVLMPVPLALWKLCELGYWLYNHVHFTWE